MGYGQHSNASKGKRTKDDLLRSCDRGYLHTQLWGHNRLYVVYSDRAEHRLHDTAVVTKYNSGEIVIDDGGWPTLTTRTAIVQALTLATGKVCNAWRDRGGKMCVYIGGYCRIAPLPLKVTPGEINRAELKAQLQASIAKELPK